MVVILSFYVEYTKSYKVLKCSKYFWTPCILQFFDATGPGLYGSVPTATLLDLSEIHEVDYDEMAKLFAWRGTGGLIGTILTSFYMEWKPGSSSVDSLVLYRKI